jgi:large subunit ribosomal protein L38e
LPIEIYDVDEFVELSGKATECRIKRNPDDVKLKLRTARRLYTLKLEPGEEDEVISRLGCRTVEI